MFMAVMQMSDYWQFPSVSEGAIRSKRYEHFRGVDFSVDASAVSDSRSPDALNLIADSGGFPEKRLGWRVLKDETDVENIRQFIIEKPVNGLFYFGDGKFVAHGGSKLYLWDKQHAPQPVCDENGVPYQIKNAKSCAFLFENRLYLLTGEEYLVFDGERLKPVYEEAFVPTTMIAATPAGVGERYQYANMLTPKRKNTFVADGTTALYQLDSKNIASVEEIKVNGELCSAFTFDAAAGTVSFETAPAVPAVLGIPNVEIAFSVSVEAAADSRYANKNIEDISRCTMAAYYFNRFFFAGNSEHPNIDYACELYDPAYFPTTAYTAIGSDKTAIMGYLKLGDAMAIVKEESTVDAAVYLRTAQMGTDDVEFPVAQGTAGIGALAEGSFANLMDDALFLGRNGVYAVATQSVNLQKTVQPRSSLVNAMLVKEAGLENAKAVVWNGYYMLCVNGHCYLADSRQKTAFNNVTGTYEYEWFFWDNFPAACLLEHRGELFFGTADGEICMLNSDMKTEVGNWQMQAFADDYKIGGDKAKKAAINAYWTTPRDDDGSFMTYKTMLRAGGGLYLKAYTRSGVKIYVITDSDFGSKIKETRAGIFDFNDIDFEHFTFNTLPQNVIPFNHRKRKYKTIQFRIQNDELNQGFGFYAIERKFVTGSLVK